MRKLTKTPKVVACNLFERPYQRVCHALGDHHVKLHQAVGHELRGAHAYYRLLNLVWGDIDILVLLARAADSLAATSVMERISGPLRG